MRSSNVVMSSNMADEVLRCNSKVRTHGWQDSAALALRSKAEGRPFAVAGRPKFGALDRLGRLLGICLPRASEF